MLSLNKRSEPYKSKNLQWIRFKKFVFSKLDRIPLLKPHILSVWRNIKWLLLKCRWKIEGVLKINNGVDYSKIYYIEPRKIRYCALKEFDIYNFRGKIIGGNWDRLEKEFNKLDIYDAVQKVCIYGKDWKETIFYQQILDRLAKGEVLWNCKNKFELDERCKNLRLLYYKIKDEGYKTQVELLKKDSNPIKIDDEITISIGRFGDLLFSNCAHRLAIAKLLNTEKIPVKIAVRHPKWLNFRKEILLYAKEHGGKLYQSITHPDLNDIPTFHKSTDRFTMIKNNLSVKAGQLLDIGANWGYFCHKFEDIGFDCYAAENSPENLYFLKKLKRAENRNFKIITKSILEWEGIPNMKFDVFLALNVLHHFLKKKIDCLKFITMLQNLKVKEMFFEPHVQDEPQMKGAYKNYSNEEFVKFILKNSRLKNAKFIGEAEDGRKIYKLF